MNPKIIKAFDIIRDVLAEKFKKNRTMLKSYKVKK